MAAITASAVTALDSSGYSVGTASGKLIEYRQRFSIALSTQGGTAGDIPASVLGFQRITGVRLMYFLTATPANANVGVTLSAYSDSNSLLTFTAINGSTAAADVTGTLAVEVWGVLN